ncbi:hypothetical protein D3C86_907290 [compost metagenome]
MYYVDPTGKSSGWSIRPQPGLGLTKVVQTLPTIESIPRAVSRFQALAALQESGDLDAVMAWANSPTTDPIHRLALENATDFSADSPTILAGASAMGWPQSKIDALFTAAAKFAG